MNQTTNKNADSGRLVDVSLFTRWVNNLDEKDKLLNARKRKSKWLIILGILFLAFTLSFLLFSGAGMSYQQLDSPGHEAKMETSDSPGTYNYEMDVDTFEQLLKQQIHESISEQK